MQSYHCSSVVKNGLGCCDTFVHSPQLEEQRVQESARTNDVHNSHSDVRRQIKHIDKELKALQVLWASPCAINPPCSPMH
jgi:hypothetical protein